MNIIKEIELIIDATTYQPITVTRFVSLIGFWEPPGS